MEIATFSKGDIKKCHTLVAINKAINGLGIVIGIYVAICVILLIIIMVIAFLHPNRLYRLGFTCSCFYVCCSDRYSSYDSYYQNHTYSKPIYFYGSSGSKSESDNNPSKIDKYTIIKLVIILICVIILAVVLAYTLFLLVKTADEEEKEFELNESASASTVDNGQNTTIQQPMIIP